MPTFESGTKPQGYKAPAVHKAFQMLRSVAASKKPMGLTELAQQLGYSKSTTHGLVHALLREGALVREENERGLYLGPAISDLTFTNWNYLKINELTQPIVNAIRDRVCQTVFFGVVIHKRVMIMTTAEASEPLKISGSTGSSISLLAGAVGKVLLSTEKPGRVKQLLREKGLPQYTPRSILDENAYLHELERVRQQGYAVDNEEYLAGIKAVAVAIRNPKAPPMAVWVVGLSSIMTESKIRQVAGTLVSKADALRNTLEGLKRGSRA